MQQLPAAVLVVLRYLMQEAAAVAPGAQVGMVGPAERGGSVERGISIWLYHVSPALNFERSVTAADALATVDLHVLLTCTGDERNYEPARLLGGCVATVEAHPVLRAQHATQALRAIEGHGLQVDHVLRAWVDLPLTLQTLSVADQLGLWGACAGARGLCLACRVQSVPCRRSRHG